MTAVCFPSRCAVAVICGDHLVSQVYPGAVPLEVFIDSAVELLSEDLKRRGAGAFDTGIAYELHRANGTRLDITRSLDELGVEDGSTLLLIPAQQGDSFEPQYESLSTGLARVGSRLFPPVTARTAAHTGIALTAIAAFAILLLATRARLGHDALMPSGATGATGLLLAAGAFASRRWSPGRIDLTSGMGWPAVVLLAGAFAAAAPGALGSAHAFIAVLAVAILTCVVVMAIGCHLAVATTVVTLCAIAGLVSAIRMWRPVPSQWLGMGVLIGLLVLLTLAPTLALLTARIRPPHFGSVTGRDLFRRGDGMAVDAVAPVHDSGGNEDGAEFPTPDPTPRGAVIAGMATRANAVLTGICAGAAISLPFAVWSTLIPGRPRSAAAAVLAALMILIFISRARMFADRRQAVALVCGAACAVSAGVVRYVLHFAGNDGPALLWGTAVLIGFAAAGLAAGLLVPVTRFTPLVRMVAEWLELLAIVAALPLAAWVGGVFSWVRMR